MILGSPGADVFFLLFPLPVFAAAGAVVVAVTVDAVAWLAARVRG